MIPMGLSSHALARALGVTAACVNDIVNEKRGITADTAQRLGRYFDTMANVWIDLQKAVRAREALILIVIPESRSDIRDPVPLQFSALHESHGVPAFAGMTRGGIDQRFPSNCASRTWQHADAHRSACCLIGVRAYLPLPQGAASACRPRGDWPRPRFVEHMA